MAAPVRSTRGAPRRRFTPGPFPFTGTKKKTRPDKRKKPSARSICVQRANHRGTTFVRMCSHTSFPITQGQAEMTTFWNLFRLSHHLSSEATFCLSVTKPSSSLWMTLSEVGASILLFFLAFPIYGTKFRWKQRLCQGDIFCSFLIKKARKHSTSGLISAF